MYLKLTKNLKAYLAIAWLAILIAFIVYLIQSFILTSGTEILNSWLQAEATNIQEGNLLSSVSKNRRILLSSNIVTGIGLIEETPSNGAAQYLVNYGIDPAAPISIPTISENPKATSVSLFYGRIFYKFPNNPDLVLIVDCQPKFAYFIFALIILIIGAFIAGGFGLIRAFNREREQLKLELINSIIQDIVKHGERNYSGKNLYSDSELGALRHTLNQLAQEMTKQRVDAAIAQTTQMLAHDVRKPFSMVRSLLSLLDTAPTGEVSGIAKQFIPEIETAIRAVNGMISDVMELGFKGELNLAATSPEELIHDALRANLRFESDLQVEFDYDFAHTHQVLVDSLKIERVFANIIGNAIQAQGGKGKLWFKTKEDQGAITFTIGNSGSFIPESERELLFESFFTKGKANGTGLGLAIAKKIVEAHGGTIYCSSDRENGTEFHFTLKADDQLSSFAKPLPKTAAELGFKRALPQAVIEVGQESPGHYIVVDDCKLTLYQWRKLKLNHPVQTYLDPQEFWQATQQNHTLLMDAKAIVTDYYFDDNDGEDGLQLAMKLRANGFEKPIYLCSNSEVESHLLTTHNIEVLSKDPKVASVIVTGG